MNMKHSNLRIYMNDLGVLNRCSMFMLLLIYVTLLFKKHNLGLPNFLQRQMDIKLSYKIHILQVGF